ncbi:MAG: tetratricopeptide repeat protein [Anaerolineae bacterium]|nr:tetratricopeptide repeat protein [Anaerolineae bacterium]MDW8100994.1 tetratricopeptide repeat protein [Anaerolineae bacterium]
MSKLRFTLVFCVFSLLALGSLVGCGRTRSEQVSVVTTSPASEFLDAPTSTSTPTIPFLSSPTASPTATPTPSPTSTPTPTDTPTATPTQPSSQRLSLALQLQIEGQHDRARRLFAELMAAPEDASIVDQARFGLARSYLADGYYQEAAELLAQVAALDSDPIRRRRAQFLLGEALAKQGAWEPAIAAYQAYLQADGSAQSEAWERIGRAYQGLQAWDQAEEAYLHAVETAPDIPTVARLREEIAQMWLGQGQPEKALAQYEAILEVARNPGYRAEILFRAGEALRALGRTGEAIERYQAAADTAPTSGYAHQALVALLDLGAPVDEYQRGVINFYNGVYQLAVAALERYVGADPDARGGQAYDFMARAYHALGLYHEAIATWDRVIEQFPQCPCWGQAWLRRAAAQARLGDIAGARAGLQTFAATYPQHELAAEALAQAARLLEDAGDCDGAAKEYRELQARYPTSKQGAESLFSAGLCMYRLKRYADAEADWRHLLNAYPAGGIELMAKTRLWLGKALLAAGKPERAVDLWRALARQPETYYGQRALALAQTAGLDLGIALPPASPPTPSDQEAAEAWLRTWIANPPAEPLAVLPPSLAQDPLLARGQELLDLGLTQEGLNALNQLRLRYQDDPLAMYRLSLLFRELHAYKLSIQCAERLIALSPNRLSEVPVFIQRLAYPTYFADLIEAEASARGLDPLLLYAMIRQESLFETSATSSAAAHGLMQIIPSTGEWIASRLGWPGYRRELLYRPYVSVKFGAYYLWSALQMLEGNLMAALAGYNAGPGNAAWWLEKADGDDDLFFLEITLSEPRVYLQRILAYYATYRRLYSTAKSAP